MFTILYFLCNDSHGCYEWYLDKDKADKRFTLMKNNSQYKRVILFGPDLKLIEDFCR